MTLMEKKSTSSMFAMLQSYSGSNVESLMRQGKDVFDAEDVSLYLANHEDKSLVCVASKSIKGSSMKYGTGIAGIVASHLTGSCHSFVFYLSVC